MTGSSIACGLRSALRGARFAASHAPQGGTASLFGLIGLSRPVCGLLGLSACLAFEFGARFRPMQARETTPLELLKYACPVVASPTITMNLVVHKGLPELGATDPFEDEETDLEPSEADSDSEDGRKQATISAVPDTAPPSMVGGNAVAVVIPALIFTEAAREILQACVAAIASDPAVKDIIVIDDGSPSPLSLTGAGPHSNL